MFQAHFPLVVGQFPATFPAMKSLRHFLALIVTAAALVAAEVPKIAPADAAKLVAEGKAVIVDCREPSEWKETGVAAPAVLLPKSDFDGDQKMWTDFLAKNKDKQVILYCRSGRRSGEVAGKLAEKGVRTANLGGLSDWTGAGMPVRKLEEKK
jgi:rhodanese-related sulfurtransferase